MSLEKRLAIFRQLVLEVRALHDAGRIHGAIAPTTIAIDDNLRLKLSPADGQARPSILPPELQGSRVLLPAEIADARQALVKAGIALDPQRIDIYQLGSILCLLLTGQDAGGYLRSPKAKAKLPANLRPLVDRSLGYSRDDRFEDCESLLQTLDAILGTNKSADTPRGIQAGLGNTPVEGGVASAAETNDQPFVRLGHYEILRCIGRGGMGDVYLGYEPALKRQVAIKVLPADLARNQDFVRRFHAEAAALARLAHPNIVPVFFTGKEGTHHFFVMPFVKGESLDRRLAREGRLEVADAVPVLKQCLAGLGTAHQAGLVHRDVKPANILIEQESRRAMVADFGLVMTAGAGNGLTPSGMILGTVDYISPEQARGRKADGRADLYSLGVVAYQMLSGRLPFQAQTPSVMIYQHAYERPLPLLEAAPGVPASLAAVVGKLMAKTPADRYASAEDALADLDRWEAGQPTLAEQSPPSEAVPKPDGLVDATAGEKQPRRFRKRWWLAACGCAMVVAASIYLYYFLAGPASLPAVPGEPTGQLAPPPAPAQPAKPIVPVPAPDKFILARQARITEANQIFPVNYYPCSLTISPDSNYLLAGEKNGTIRLIDLTGMVTRTFAGHTSSVTSLAFTPDGKQFLSASGDNTVRLWDVGTGKEIRTFVGHTKQVLCVACSPDGTKALSGAMDFTARLWDMRTGKELFCYRGHRNIVGGVAISPKGTSAITSDGSLHLWDLATGKNIQAFPHSAAWKVMFLAGGSQALSGGSDNVLRLWDLDNLREIGRLHGHSKGISGIAVSPDQSYVLSSSYDKTLRLYDLASRQEVHLLLGHTAAIFTAAFAPNGKWFASAGSDRTIRIWDMGKVTAKKETGHQAVPQPLMVVPREERRLVGHKGDITGLAVFPDGKRAITSATDHTTRIWELATGKELARVAGNLEVTCLALGEDGKQLLIGGADHCVRFWDLQTGKELLCLKGHAGPVSFVALSPDGKRAMAAANDAGNTRGVLLAWDLTTGKLLQRHETDPGTFAVDVAWCVDGHWAAFPTRSNQSPASRLILWNPEERILKQYPITGHPDTITSLSVSPTGKSVLTGSQANLILSNPETGWISRNVALENIASTSVAYSPDRRLVISSGPQVKEGKVAACPIHLWNMPQFYHLCQFDGHEDLVTHLAFCPDGRRFLSCSKDGTIRLWEIPSPPNYQAAAPAKQGQTSARPR